MAMQIIKTENNGEVKNAEEYDYLPDSIFEKLKDKVLSLVNNEDYHIRYVVGLIWDLYNIYYLSDEQESQLYSLVDKDEKYNNCSEYYNEWLEEYGIDSANPLAIFVDEEYAKYKRGDLF